MSAADRMVVRKRNGEVRSMPRRQALALIAAGRAEAEKRSRLAEPITARAVEVRNLATGEPASVEIDGIDQSATFTPMPPTVEIEITTTPETAALLGLQPVSVLVDEDVPTVEAVPLPPEPKPSARRGEWAEYADSLGVEVTSAMTKREIQQAAEEAAQSLSNLPQPALTGGRLETPEDEPVTDGSVTDDEDSRTQ
jgi:hypothetical protein